MIYVVEKSSGSYSDYRTKVMFYTTDKKKAEKFCKDAKDAAHDVYVKAQALNDKMQGPLSDEDWDRLYKRGEKLKSKFDKDLSSYEAYDVNYYVLKIKELK